MLNTATLVIRPRQLEQHQKILIIYPGFDSGRQVIWG